MSRVVTYAFAGMLAVIIFLGAAAAGVVAAFFGGGSSDTTIECPPMATLPAGVRTGTEAGTQPAGLSAEQDANAAVIVAVGQRLEIPTRGWVIAMATALQESNLINSATVTDHDSVGLFQQRPSQGWGTVAQIMNPDYAATRFYQALGRVPGWQTMPLTAAAQAVQKSKFPDAYAKHEPRAAAIVAAHTATAGPAGHGCGVLARDGLPADVPPGDIDGVAPQVVTAVRWALAQVGTPYSFGGSCTAPRSGDPARQCDCSSLVQQAYAAAGIHIPRTTYEQFRGILGRPIMPHVRPGDLVFIPGANGTPSDPRHVGLAIGGGRLVHAPQTGDVVKVIYLSDWRGQPITLRRIFS